MALVQAMMLYVVGRLMAITAGAMNDDTFYRLIKLATMLCIICVVAQPLWNWMNGLREAFAEGNVFKTILDFLLMYPTGNKF